MNGRVDDKLRALLPIGISAASGDQRQEIVAWVDTAFNGGLVIPKSLVESLALVQESSAEAILADGQVVELETYKCSIDWFGETYETQVVANDSKFPLLGTMLLKSRRLEIDYKKQTVSLT